MLIPKYCLPPREDDGEATPIDLAYARKLREENRMWRRALRDERRENAKFKIALILLKNGSVPPWKADGK